MSEFLVIDPRLCCQCGYCATIAPGEIDSDHPGIPIVPSTTVLLAMAECPNSAIVWADLKDAAQ